MALTTLRPFGLCAGLRVDPCIQNSFNVNTMPIYNFKPSETTFATNHGSPNPQPPSSAEAPRRTKVPLTAQPTPRMPGHLSFEELPSSTKKNDIPQILLMPVTPGRQAIRNQILDLLKEFGGKPMTLAQQRVIDTMRQNAALQDEAERRIIERAKEIDPELERHEYEMRNKAAGRPGPNQRAAASETEPSNVGLSEEPAGAGLDRLFAHFAHKEEQRREAEELRRKAEEAERQRLEEEARRQQEEESRRQAELERKKQEEIRRKKEKEEAERQRLQAQAEAYRRLQEEANRQWLEKHRKRQEQLEKERLEKIEQERKKKERKEKEKKEREQKEQEEREERERKERERKEQEKKKKQEQEREKEREQARREADDRERLRQRAEARKAADAAESEHASTSYDNSDEAQLRSLMEEHDRYVQTQIMRINECAFGESAAQIASIYEEKWTKLRARDIPGPCCYREFPFPVFFPLDIPPLPAHITYERVCDFVLSPYRTGMEGKKGRFRVRQELRYWHPDHFDQDILPLVEESHRSLVKEAADNIAKLLTRLLSDNARLNNI